MKILRTHRNPRFLLKSFKSSPLTVPKKKNVLLKPEVWFHIHNVSTSVLAVCTSSQHWCRNIPTQKSRTWGNWLSYIYTIWVENLSSVNNLYGVVEIVFEYNLKIPLKRLENTCIFFSKFHKNPIHYFWCLTKRLLFHILFLILICSYWDWKWLWARYMVLIFTLSTVLAKLWVDESCTSFGNFWYKTIINIYECKVFSLYLFSTVELVNSM